MGKDKVFIIAEIGSNHNQSFKHALELMDIAKEAGADAVKFQSLNLEKVIFKEDITDNDRELFLQIKLEEDWYAGLFAYADKIKIECISAPTYLEALNLLQDCGIRYIKIASPQTYGFPELIKRVAQSGVQTIMSTGYCEDREIKRAVKLYKRYGDMDKLTLLHCVSEYPTEAVNVNLNYMKKLQDVYQVAVGYSDHTCGIIAPIMAVAMGASMIEKHITTSRKEKGPDHFFAAEPDEFRQMVANIRTAESMLGTGEKKLTDFELQFRESIVMYPYAKRKICTGNKITEDDIQYFRSKSKGMSPWDAENNLIGAVAKADLLENQKF